MPQFHRSKIAVLSGSEANEIVAAGILWMKNMSAGNYIGAKEKTSNDHGGASRIKPPKQLINCFA